MGKISGYTAIVAADVAAADVLPIVDTSATETKKIRADLLLSALLFSSAADITYAAGLVTLAHDLKISGGDLDLGLSGTAGTLDIFPTTASKGKTQFTATDNTGNTTTTITNAAQAGAVTYTIPDAGASASFVMTEGAQTINGAKTIAALVTTNIDAGASGTAGTLDIFPTTASKGKTQFTATDNTGNTTTTITNAAQAGAVTYTIPDAGASASFVMTEGAQTVNGTKTIGAILGTTNTTATINCTNLDAGASGTAGSIDVFPSTASKGKLAITCTDQTGNTTVTLNVAACAAARAVSLPDALADGDILIGKQAAVARTATVLGDTTGTIAAAGRDQHITVTSSNSAHIVILPTPTPGTQIVLDVGSNGFQLQSSTPASIGINGGTGAGVKSAIPANSTVFMTCVSATSWKGFYMDADGDVAKVPAAA